MDFTYGIDPSLRHGSVIQLWKSSSVYDWREILNWSGRRGLSENSDSIDIGEHVSWIFETLDCLPRGLVVIEFDPTSVYWRSGKKQIVTLAWFLGYLVSRLHSSGFKTLILTPRTVRTIFGFQKGPKEEFQKFFLDFYHQDFTSKAFDKVSPSEGSDVLDAVMIAYAPILGRRDGFDLRTSSFSGS